MSESGRLIVEQKRLIHDMAVIRFLKNDSGKRVSPPESFNLPIITGFEQELIEITKKIKEIS